MVSLWDGLIVRIPGAQLTVHLGHYPCFLDQEQHAIDKLFLYLYGGHAEKKKDITSSVVCVFRLDVKL